MAFTAAIALLLVLAPAASARLRGELDPSFGDGGKVLLGFGPTLANSSYSAIARQPDGSLVLAGHTESVQGKYVERAVLVQRRLPDGQLDPSFHRVVDGDDSYGPTALALQPDGDVLYTTGGEYQGTVVRLNPDGTRDASYGKGGAATVPFKPSYLAVDAQGRTVVAGTAGIGGDCHDCLPTPVMAVARLLPDGSLDKSFGKGGSLTVIQPTGASGGAVGLALEADGRVVIAGAHDLFGLTASGAPDPAFGHEGTLALDGTVGALTETTAGDLIEATTSADGCCDQRGGFVLHAFGPTGSPDPAWGNGGTLTIQVADIDAPTASRRDPKGR